MALFDENRPDRLVIPRWREFQTTAKSKELAKSRISPSVIPASVSIKKQIDDWNTDKSVTNAIGLVNSAYIVGRNDEAIEAAKFIVDKCKDDQSPVLQIAKKILLIDEKQIIESEVKQEFAKLNARISSKISSLRISLGLNPHNAIRWVDLSRWYYVIGKQEKAEYCIKCALQLAPCNIFVLRSAVRLYLQKNDKESLLYALNLLRKNPRLKDDPWLMATEITLSRVLNKTSNYIKKGLALVNSQNHSPFSTSELLSAIATEEMNHSVNSSKKLFNSSLADPNENSIAQAEWATKHLGDLSLGKKEVNSFEANSYINLHQGNYEGAFNNALNWVIDQPFSNQPAHHASYVASALLDDNEMSIDICEFGLRANPNEFALLNNFAYSLAVMGKIKEAERAFGQIHLPDLSGMHIATYLATKGMINYRIGNIEFGRKLYDEAEALAISGKDEKVKLLVKIHKIKAELICDCLDANAFEEYMNIIKEGQDNKDIHVKRTTENLKQKLVNKFSENSINNNIPQFKMVTPIIESKTFVYSPKLLGSPPENPNP